MPNNLEGIFPYKLLLKKSIKKQKGLNLPKMTFLKASFESNYEETKERLRTKYKVKDYEEQIYS